MTIILLVLDRLTDVHPLLEGAVEVVNERPTRLVVVRTPGAVAAGSVLLSLAPAATGLVADRAFVAEVVRSELRQSAGPTGSLNWDVDLDVRVINGSATARDLARVQSEVGAGYVFLPSRLARLRGAAQGVETQGQRAPRVLVVPIPSPCADLRHQIGHALRLRRHKRSRR